MVSNEASACFYRLQNLIATLESSNISRAYIAVTRIGP